MRKPLFVLAALCLAPALLARPAGEVYTSAAGGYSATFPGTPKEETRTQPGPVGEVKVHLAYYASTNGVAYLTSYHDYPGRPPADQQKAILDAVVKGAAADGKLAETKDVTHGDAKLPGRSYRVDKGKTAVRGVVVLKDGRVYQAVVAGPKDLVGGKDATAFLESFTVSK
jgi:hypothetical protein